MKTPAVDNSTGRMDAADIGVPGPYRGEALYTDRASKAAYIAEKYAAILGGSVLDVGCDAAPLRALVGDPARYVGVDMREDADVVLNLDRDHLPFADRSFDTVVCTDVLEHLERCHAVLDELCRVSRGRVIASLPNPLLSLVRSLIEGRHGRMKYYGLPVDRPADRHRWFFGFEEAAAFLTERGRRAGFVVEQLDVESVDRWYWRTGKGEGRDVLDSPQVLAGTFWCVLRRAEGGAA